MKNNFKLNFLSNSIEVTTSFAKKASIYGSTEYLMLTEAQKAHPEYKLTILKPKKTAIKGIDYEFMRNYIVTHDESTEMLTAFEKLVKGNLSYPEVKAWFVEQYPVFKDCKTRADWILAA
jgi:hypothetical protein